METVLEDFNERAKEVNDYVNFIKDLETEKIKISSNNKLSKIDVELLKTLKATAYLLLYNLVESSMRDGIQFIFDKIITNNTSFDNLRKEFKKLIWQNLKSKNIDELTENIVKITTDIIITSFDPSNLFSGNVDAKEIRETSKKYGFSDHNNYSQTRGGADLLSIKKNRNDLAHGLKSFNDVGKDVTGEDLVEISERVIKYLREILNNIEHYIDQKQYLEPEQ